MPLSLALGPHAADRFAGRMNADLATIEHLDAGNIEGMSGAGAYGFCEAGDADAHQLALLALFCLLFAEIIVADHLQSFVHGSFIVAAVVGPAQGRLVRELRGSDEIFSPKLYWVHLQLACQHVYDSFD